MVRIPSDREPHIRSACEDPPARPATSAKSRGIRPSSNRRCTWPPVRRLRTRCAIATIPSAVVQ